MGKDTTIKKHWYKNAYVEEEIDEHGNVLSYKQWNDGELIIHREWVCPKKHTSTLYRDIISGYWRKTSYHKLGEYSISNSWDSDGRDSQHFFKLEIDKSFNTAITTRMVSKYHNWDTGFKITKK